MEKVKSKYGLPKKVVFCSKCVISNQRPSSSIEFKSSDPFNKKGINIEEDQVCSACKFHEKKKKELIGIKEKKNF